MAHLSDSNANFTTKAVHVIGVVVASAGPSMAKLANLVVGVADNKKAMRAFVAAVRDDGAQDPVGRAELLGWTVEMTQTVAGKMDLRSLVETTIDALSDKSTAVRHKAKLLLVEVFKSVGRDAVQVGCRGMVPANIDTVKPPARPPPLRVEATSPKPPSIPASSSPKDTLLLFVPLERLVMRQGLTVIPGELKAGKDAVKSLYSRSSIGDDVFIQEKPRQRDRRPCVAGARRGVWHMASLCVVTISSTFRHAPYVGRV
ncbi:hypothetical protein DYB25_001951 [Aphanomyces astaci]|uniref:Uncharacterized protein n=1 Tax=Aphanomyces astaci TaxID=112090 RepID=A0A397B8C4_APHAT|nr:hypothetical protein DYB25_001951 [Aphanomyces astaci]RHY16624.1 hypothetical protein DYB36_001805 [Aphanomyces astaci]RHY39814.1 hypothetical protein DYB30_006258 [Aphanomyces astaci]RHY43104.1 hypothetical protein DYB34_006491 [Aphanomyces astaci]RHZ22978.1 hypothetical protein DYB26_004509 [Aphanomyces astaci]